MKNPFLIALDIDNVVFEDVLEHWVDFMTEDDHNFNRFYDKKILYDAMIESKEYNMEPIFNSFGLYDCRKFWKLRDLYTHYKISPSFKCIKVIDKWKSLGYDVIFISACYPEHYGDKQRRLQEFFPDVPFFSGWAKKFMRANVFVDDKPSTCESVAEYDPEVNVIQFMSRCQNLQRYDVEYKNVTVIKSWDALDRKVDEIVERMNNERS